MRPSNRYGFAIAIICALPVEAEAVEDLFDETYDRFEKHYGKLKGDENSYLHGRIGEHDVVLGYMHRRGKKNAAIVASNLLMSYPKVRLALVVGTCGGAPVSPDDKEIFLGDVIISDSVIEYDFRRQYPGGGQRKTGIKDMLARPDREISARLFGFHMANARKELERRTQQHLHILRSKRTKWTRPKVNDILFKAEYIHKHNSEDTSNPCSCFESGSPDRICDEALDEDCDGLGCDSSQLLRHREPSESAQTSVHIGTFASGDTEMRSAELRDEIIRYDKVIGFEMEGAGVWDNVPCVIIKGVCNYADSHQSKVWQEYASAAAASVAKAFLYYWWPANRADALTETVQSGQGPIFSDKHKKCLSDLLLTDPKDDLSELKRRIGNRTAGTCGWFLESDKLRMWFQQEKPIENISQNVLWLCGNPGIGKSTMAMTLVEELPKQDYYFNLNSVLSFFFCESGSEHRRTATSILRGLLYGLIRQLPSLIEPLMSKYEVQGELLFMSFDALWAVLMEISQMNQEIEIYCIVDGLDKCETESQYILLQQIYLSFWESALSSSVTSNLHFLITSRPFPDIRDRLSYFSCVDLGTCKQITEDIGVMIKDKVQNLAMRKNYSESVAQKVSQLLEEKAEGTFLWIGTACKELENVQSRKAIETLEAMPGRLYSLYQHLLSEAITASEPSDYIHVKLLLAVVMFALRPLTIAELAEACQLYPDEDLTSRLQFTREIIDLCRLLVVVDQDGYVRLLHSSVQDFLMTEMPDLKPANFNYTIASRCIQLVFQRCRPDMDRSALDSTDGFLGYSVLHWPQHASLAETEFSVQDEHVQFFQNAFGTWITWLHSYNSLSEWEVLETGTSIIHVAARWGIVSLISAFPQGELEAKDAHGKTPLLVAAENTQLEAMRVLIETGAHVDSLDNKNRNILHMFCKKCSFSDHAMIKTLLDKGVSPYICDKDNMIPFLYTIGEGDKEHAQAFLQDGFDVNMNITRQEWPRRAESTSCKPLYQLNRSSVDVESGLSVLHFSALKACTDMTAFLLQAGADPNARSYLGDAALHLGIRCQLLGRKCEDTWESVKYAVESREYGISDLETPEERGEVYRDIKNARIQIVEILLESEYINVNIANDDGDYPQHVINFYEDHALSILDKLVKKGADISRQNSARQTCLHLASKAGNLEVVRRFVNEGHDIMLQDADGRSPFHYAVLGGHLHILRFMSETCNDTLSKVWHSLDNFGQSPLHHYVSLFRCSVEFIEFLIQVGCNVNQGDIEGNSPLSLYLGSDHSKIDPTIVSLLVSKGADRFWVNMRGENLAQLLMQHKGTHEAVLILGDLFDNGLDPAATDLEGKTLMHHAAIHGVFTQELVEFLKLRDVFDPHVTDSTGKTSLDYAEEEANQEYPEDCVTGHHDVREQSYKILKATLHS